MTATKSSAPSKPRCCRRQIPQQWDTVKVGDLASRDTTRVPADCDLGEALRLLVREGGDQMLLVTDDNDRLVGIVTKTDILRSFQDGGRILRGAAV